MAINNSHFYADAAVNIRYMSLISLVCRPPIRYSSKKGEAAAAPPQNTEDAMVSTKMVKMGRMRSCIREIFEYGRQQARLVGAENVMDFSLGNPSVPPPPEVSDALIDIVKTEAPIRVHGYTSAVGSDEARDAIAASLSERLQRPFSRRNIYITCGAAAALMASFKAFTIDADSEIITVSPFFPEYRCFVESAGAKLIIVPADQSTFQLDIEAIRRAVTRHTQAVIINTPNNPSGVVYTPDTIDRLGQMLRDKSAEVGHPIYIVSDEPYRELVYDNVTVPFIPDYYANTIICYSYSKSLSLPGDRIGYMCVPDCMEDFNDVCDATAGSARALGYVCAPAIMQRVIARCASVPANIEAYRHNRELLFGGLSEMGYDCVKPDGAFYLFVRAPGGNAEAFCARAKAHNVLVVPGDDFGCPTHMRISYCVKTDTILRALPLFGQLIAEA